MFNWFKEARPRPQPIIKRDSEIGNLPPAERYALHAGRAYRTFPDDLPESAIPGSCASCGASYDGPTQSHCRACDQGRPAYKIDVTDEPFHTLPPKKEGDAPTVNAAELIPVFGGGDIILGNKTEAPCAFGSKVKIESDSSVDQIVGNHVLLGWGITSSVVVAKDRLEASTNFTCEDEEGGLTAKEIFLDWNADIAGKIVLPDGGKLYLGKNCTIDRLIVGADATIVAQNKLEVETLIILGPNVKISLGEECSIGAIESDHLFQLQTGRSFSNDTRTKLQEDYNLAVEISDLIDRALNLDL